MIKLHMCKFWITLGKDSVIGEFEWLQGADFGVEWARKF